MPDPAAVGLLRPGDHVCWTFDADEQRVALAAELVRAGLAAQEKVFYYTDSLSPDSVVKALDHRGVPVKPMVAAGQLSVRPATETYRGRGQPWAASMVAAWGRDIDQARKEGWPGVRVLGDMAWAARRAIGADRVAWSEAQINRVLMDGYATAVCLYDRRIFAAAELHRITAAHPATASGDAAPVDGWRPLLRFRRTVDPTGLRLCGEADASNRDALTAVLTGLVDEATELAGAGIWPDTNFISRPTGHRVPAPGHRVQPSGRRVQPPGDMVRPVAGADRRFLVTVDVSELTFADGATADLLVRTAHAAPTGLRLAGCSPGLARLIDLVADHALPAGLVLEPA